ncbi:MAG: hypothetical protein ACKOFA_00345, partial [Rhodoluna sp.]
VLGLSSSLPALGYPAGQAPVLGLSSASRILPGDPVSVQISRVKPGCSVTVRWLGEDVTPITRTINASGKSGSISIATPSTAGTYTLSTNSISAACTGGSSATLTKSIVVGRLASIVGKVSSTSAFSSKNPTFSVSGTVKSGSVAVGSQSVSITLKRNGSTVKSGTATTNGSGVFTLTLPGNTYSAGDYTAVITIAAGAVYGERQITTAKLTLR